MEFNEKIGAIQQQLSGGTNIGIIRRQAILKELNLERNQTVVDIGCGGGHLVEEIALCIGACGKVFGVDTSQFQINSAIEKCKNLSNVEFLCCNANAISIDDRSCDAVTFTQTLEYIENVDEVLTEAKRLQKSNSKFVNISTLWDYFGFHGPEKKLNDMMHDSYRSQKHPMIPTQLNGKLAMQGYKNIRTQDISFFLTNKDENSFPKFHEINMVNAAKKNSISDDLIQKWQDQLARAENEGCFAFTIISVLTSAYFM